jgi:hypothetical protein
MGVEGSFAPRVKSSAVSATSAAVVAADHSRAFVNS